MEVLGQSIRQAMDTKQWKLCMLSRGSKPISLFFFAGDLLLFGEASGNQAELIRSILDKFCVTSSQKVNITKSRVWYSPNTAKRTVRFISQNFGIPSTLDLGRYLGVPLFHGRRVTQYFHYLVDRVKNKLGGWQHKLLSRAARLLLIKNVTTTIPGYVMNVCKFPTKTIVELSSPGTMCANQSIGGDLDFNAYRPRYCKLFGLRYCNINT